MACDMCGAKEPLEKTMVEGAILNLCHTCKKVGTPIKDPKTFTPKKRAPRYEEKVVENAGALVKYKRESLGMRQVDLAKMLLIKESLIHHIEVEDIPLTLELAKKIEEMLKIALVEKELLE
ncbi:MAG: helix-turn-helix domain-containing protein [Candidatus Woesearchaeota archaeon]